MRLSVIALATMLTVSCAVGQCFAKFTEKFDGKAVNEANWALDNDSGYELSVSGGVLRIAGGPEGSGGPCDGIASLAWGTKYSFEVNPVKLNVGPELKDEQMAVVYFAQTAQRGGPVTAWGFIADPAGDGKVALAWLDGNAPEWQIVKAGMSANKWYTLGGVVKAADETIDLLLDGKVVATCERAFGEEAPSLVIRCGSWDGANEGPLEALFRNVTIE